MTNCVHTYLEAVQIWDTWSTGILPCVFKAYKTDKTIILITKIL